MRERNAGKKVRETDTMVRVEGEADVLQVLEQRFPYSLRRRSWWSSYLPADHGENQARAGGYFLKEAAAHGKPMLEQVLLTGTAAGGESTLDQVYPEGLQPVERTRAGAVLEGWQPMGKTHVGAGEKCEEEGAAERNCHGQAASHYSPSPLHCSG